ncbi:MAG: hypothetical protein AAF485_32095 [Chloroflexota bacterium]
MLHNIFRHSTSILFSLIWALSIAFFYHSDRPDLLKIHVEMTSSMPGVLQVFVDDGKGFREDLSSSTQVISSLDTIDYDLQLILPAGASSLRIDPINAPATLQLKHISIEYYGQSQEFSNGGLEVWQAAQHLKPVTLPPGEAGRYLQSIDVDPALLLNLSEPFQTITTVRYFSSWLISFFPTQQGWLLIFAGIGLIVFAGRTEHWQVQPLKGNAASHLVAILLSIAWLWVLYHHALNNWFNSDDPCHMAYLVDTGIWPAFSAPEKGGSASSFTPLFFLSFGLNLTWFELNPSYYYWHHLISYSLSLGLVYLVLARFLSPIVSVFAVSVFVASVTSAEAVNHLMERHYIEGLGLAAAALFCYIQAIRRNNLVWACVGSLPHKYQPVLSFEMMTLTNFFPVSLTWVDVSVPPEEYFEIAPVDLVNLKNSRASFATTMNLSSVESAKVSVSMLA